MENLKREIFGVSNDMEMAAIGIVADYIKEHLDKLTDTKPEGRLCNGCKHNEFPDGDGACYRCCEYYDCQYAEE